MLKKDLAQALNISPAMVSRLAKRGMPTDTPERAERWRKRHLEPGRVKGMRAGTTRATPAPSPARSAPDVQAGNTAPDGQWLDSAMAPLDSVVVSKLEAAALLVDAALVQGNTYAAAVRTHQLRELLANMADGASPRLTVRVWVALLDFVMHEDADIRTAPHMGELVTPAECGALITRSNSWPGHSVIFHACDYDGVALNGWPDGIDDD